jgi:hypothetical protein
MDYNGYCDRPASAAGPNSRDTDRYAISFSLGGTFPNGALKRYASLAEFTAATGYEQHGRLVDYDIFQNVQPHPWLDDPPKGPAQAYDPAALDYRLRAGSAALDAGCVLPNVTEGFTGKAPDLGALEFGRPVPHYGPRRRVLSEEKRRIR